MIKLLVVGNQNAGKTQFISRFVSNRFDDEYRATIACDFSIKLLQIDGNELRLQIWDLQGQDRVIGGINKLFCKGASGALVVADITEQESIENTANWKRKINENVSQQVQMVKQSIADANGGNVNNLDDDDPGIPMLLVLNKYDLAEQLVNQGYELEDFMTFDYLKKFAEDYGFIGAVCTSAKSGVGVTEAVSALVRQILLNELQDQQACIDCREQNGALVDQVYENENVKIKKGKEAMEKRVNYQNTTNDNLKLDSRHGSGSIEKIKGKKKKKCKC